MIKHKNENEFTLFGRLNLVTASVLIAVLSACGGGKADTGGNGNNGGGNSGGGGLFDPSVELPIAYVRRSVPLDNNNNLLESDLRDPVEFRPGAHLMVKASATLSALEVDVTAAIIGDTGDVRDPEFNYDGTRLVFSLFMEDDNMGADETWDIYEYNLTQPLSQSAGSENPRRIMIIDDAILGHDIGPSYLPGNRIIFSSTRAKRTGSIALDEGGSAFSPTIEANNSETLALNIHSMDAANGANLQQLTFNMSHDLDPVMIRSIPNLQWQIMFTRWENSPGRNQMSLYAMRPDGSQMIHLYGAHSNNLGTGNSAMQFSQPRETSDGDVLVLGRAFDETQDGGAPVLVNVSGYVDNTVASNSNAGGVGPGQSSATSLTVSTDSTLSIAGRYGSVVPFNDGTSRALASFSLCFVDITNPANMVVTSVLCNDPLVNLADPNQAIAAPRYGINVITLGSNAFSPVTLAQINTYFTDVAMAYGYNTEGTQLNYSFDIANTAKIGTLHIRSVYDLDGVFDPRGSTATGLNDFIDPAISTFDAANNPALIERPAKFLRIVKGTYLPDDNIIDFDGAAYGLDPTGQLMRQIIGYAPIEPDGSVRVNVPSDVPLSFSILDADGHRISQRHNNWVVVRPGEELTCNGCHDHGSGNPHGRQSLSSPGINAAATAVNPGALGLSFPNSVNTYVVGVGQTMAYIRSESLGLTPTIDMNFTDNWTDAAAAGRPVDAPTVASYNSVEATARPLNRGACLNVWDENCRIIINYPAHVQPIWELARVDSGAIGRQCISCHTTYDAVNMLIQVPLGRYQLDLTTNSPDANGNSIDTQDADYVKSYVELLGPDNQLEVMGAALVDVAGPISVFQGTGLIEIANSGQANGSNPFFDIFSRAYYDANVGAIDPADPAAPVPHWDPGANAGAGGAWLTTGELKVISEWIDLGAQYYNNPLVAPIN